MNQFAYKTGLRLQQIGFVRHAIDDRADLSAFKARPDWRIFLGMFCIAFSFAMCWPVITALGTLSIYWKQPLIVAIGGPTIYLLSHLCYLLGMALCGGKYSLIFLRWLTRVGVEKLLASGEVPRTNLRSSDVPPVE